jgi:hypothetical protein
MDSEGSGHSLIEVLSQQLPAGTEENLKSLRITSIQAVICTEYLPNISTEHYCWTKLLSHEDNVKYAKVKAVGRGEEP